MEIILDHILLNSDGCVSEKAPDFFVKFDFNLILTERNYSSIK